MSDTKIQWHPGFVAAMNLELKKNRADLVYEKEYNLNTKPLEIDLLIIKKVPDIQIVNEVGKLFRGYNIVEYKSPEDALDIDAFYKAGAYASLYKAYGETVDERSADDITVSIVRDVKPVGLFDYFEKHDIRIIKPYRGIYYIQDKVLFPTQIIVTSELDRKDHMWLKALSDRMEKQDMKELLEYVSMLTQKFDRELADSVLEVSLRANSQMIEELRGDDSMCQALLEIMEPEINEIKKRERIKEAIEVFRVLGRSNEEITAYLEGKFDMQEAEVLPYL